MALETPMVTEKMIRDAVEAVSDEIDWVQGLFGGSYDNAEQVMRFALKAALSTDAEPVGYLVPRGDVAGPDNEYYSFCEDRGSAAAEADIYDKGYFPLYAAPTAPSVAVKADRLAIAKAMCESDGANWEAATANHTANGETPEDQREYWLGKADVAISALPAVPAAKLEEKP